MTNPIILHLKMQLSAVQKEYQELNLKMIRKINELSKYVNPFYGEDIESICADEIEQIGDEMKDLKVRLLNTKQQIKRLKAELGA